MSEKIEDLEHTGHESADEAATNEINKQLMQNPEVLAAIQRQIGGLGPSPADYIRSLPKVVKRRLKALKKLQAASNKIESKFFEEVHQLECRYATLYEPLLQKRRDIVTAVAEPTDEECDWPSDDEEESLPSELKSKAVLSDEKKNEPESKGVPEFWLTIFRNVDMLSEMIQDHDEPILKHLQDIKVHLNTPSTFKLEFIFEPNEYFTNTSLMKEYTFRFSVDEADPLNYEGPEIIKCQGCSIDWNKGKNVTVKLIKKVQKHKGRGTKRTVTKTVQADSFFNFFSPPEAPGDKEEPDEETEALLAADYEIGHFIREHIIPRAVLYFTGEALDPDDEDYEDGEDEDENEDDEEDDDDDDDEAEIKPRQIKPKGGAGKK